MLLRKALFSPEEIFFSSEGLMFSSAQESRASSSSPFPIIIPQETVDMYAREGHVKSSV